MIFAKASAIIFTMKLYYCSISEFHTLEGEELLLPGRRARLARYRSRQDQTRCLVSGLLLRFALGGDYGDLLAFGAHGKPYLTDASRFFNLSHSGDYVVLAVSEANCGVDLEQTASRYPEAAARRCLTDGERLWLEQQGNPEAFYKLWTGKEAFLKAVGTGLSLPMEQISLLPVQDGPHLLNGTRWHFCWRSLPGHILCAVSRIPEPAELIPLDRSALLRRV
ncbi:MAG: 4'-phosphopantetheinyl transferase superfamily protein [Eubacteriales bacterium]|nr:4'-phosphopantetheinyl transferase superfamily protein [Eubacteriales bacterium]